MQCLVRKAAVIAAARCAWIYMHVCGTAAYLHYSNYLTCVIGSVSTAYYFGILLVLPLCIEDASL